MIKSGNEAGQVSWFLFPFSLHILIAIPFASQKWKNVNERQQNTNTALTKK